MTSTNAAIVRVHDLRMSDLMDLIWAKWTGRESVPKTKGRVMEFLQAKRYDVKLLLCCCTNCSNFARGSSQKTYSVLDILVSLLPRIDHYSAVDGWQVNALPESLAPCPMWKEEQHEQTSDCHSLRESFYLSH